MAMLHPAPGNSHVESNPKSFQRALSLLPDARISLPRNSGLLARRSLPALGINSRQAEQLQKVVDKRSAISEPNYKMSLDSGIGQPLTPTTASIGHVKSVCTEVTFVEPSSAKSLSWPTVSPTVAESDHSLHRHIGNFSSSSGPSCFCTFSESARTAYPNLQPATQHSSILQSIK